MNSTTVPSGTCNVAIFPLTVISCGTRWIADNTIGYRQKQLKPTEKKHILPEPCDCGCSTIVPGSLKPYYTHQVIELPEIDMDVLHVILTRGTCCHCGKTVKAAIPKEHPTASYNNPQRGLQEKEKRLRRSLTWRLWLQRKGCGTFT
ncbi:MAG: hypothetical protein U9R43_15450 [Thermodesulfobacteriota bacterium]|nr:hypothetical protein [Thermodesulfobacteriota bacterium]